MQINKLTDEVKKELEQENDEVKKAQIRKAFKQIEAKEKGIEKLQEEIKDLKEQLRTGEFKLTGSFNWCLPNDPQFPPDCTGFISGVLGI